MLFALLAATKSAWSWLALRDRPLRHYVLIYAVTAAMGCFVECTTLGIFYPFEVHMHVVKNHYQDLFITEILVKLFMFPLIGCLYVRYAGRHPVRTALIGALAMGLIERGLLAAGVMVYFRWNTIFTVLLFLGLFAVLRWVVSHPIALWADTGATAFVAAYISHQVARVLMLWQYRLPLPIYMTDSLFLVGKNLLLAGPSALAIALVPGLRSPVAILAAVGVNVAADAWLRTAGIMTFSGWNLWLSGLRYLAIIWITVAYHDWQAEGRTAPLVLGPVPAQHTR